MTANPLDIDFVQIGVTRKIGNTTIRFDPVVCVPHKFVRSEDNPKTHVCLNDGSTAVFGEDGKLEEFTSSYCAKVPELMIKSGGSRREDA